MSSDIVCLGVCNCIYCIIQEQVLDITKGRNDTMEELTISEFCRRTGKSDKTVRNWIKKKKLQSSKKMLDGRLVSTVYIENDTKIQSDFQDVQEPISKHIQEHKQDVQEAEFITENTSYNMVSMENTTFERLITQIQELAEARAQAEEKTSKNIQEHLMEEKTKVQILQEKIDTIQNEYQIKLDDLRSELSKEKILAAQIEAGSKIKDLRIKELEDKLSKYDDQQNKINTLEQQSNSSNIWFKKL